MLRLWRKNPGFLGWKQVLRFLPLSPVTNHAFSFDAHFRVIIIFVPCQGAVLRLMAFVLFHFMSLQVTVHSRIVVMDRPSLRLPPEHLSSTPATAENRTIRTRELISNISARPNHKPYLFDHIIIVRWSCQLLESVMK
jgi:hypothetical protein